MRILVLHRIPDSFVRYAENIDHSVHDVVYVSARDRAATLPAGVRAHMLERPGTGDTAAEVLSAVAHLPAPHAVIAMSEYDLLAAAQVREALGVPGPRERDVLPTRDKLLMKEAAASAGIRVPRFLALPDALSGGVPWQGATILKPVAGASSEGVRSFPTVPAVLTAAVEDGVAEGWEVEEFVDGPIIHIDGLVTGGELITVQASRYVGTCLAYAEGSPLGSVQIDTDERITEWTARCLRAVGIEEGPFHLEGIEAADGLVFLEVAARFGGADVVDTFELATGVRMPAAQLRFTLEEPGEHPAARVPGPGERYGWFVFPGHTLGAPYCRISGAERFRSDAVVWRWVERAPDEPIKASITYADADVPLAGVVGPAPTDVLERFLTELFAGVRIEPLRPPMPMQARPLNTLGAHQSQ